MSFPKLRANLARVREEIARVQAREGCSDEVMIVAVTKGHGLEAVGAAMDAGLRDMGENRVQAAMARQSAGLPVRWHLIGHLQTNKAKHVPGRFAMVQSVDSIKVIEALEKHGEKATTRLPVLVQVNLAGETQKSGCAPDEAESLVVRLLVSNAMSVEGLMTMAPYTDDEDVQRTVFGRLRQLRDDLAVATGTPLRHLSMGMSGDYQAAVAEGATMLRLGTVLFGERTA